MRKLLVLLSFVLILTVNSYSEVVFGGEGSFSVPIMVNPQMFLKSELTFNSVFLPGLAVYSDSYELYGTGEISYLSNNNQLFYTVSELYINFYPTDELFVKIGRFPYFPGTAEFFSNTNFFGSTNMEKLLSGNFSSASVYSDMIQSGLFIGNNYFILTLEPFFHYPKIPDPGTPWFPMKDIPESIHISFPSDQDLLLENLTVDEVPASTMLADSSISLEAGTTMGMFDISLLYFHGLDKSLIFQGEMNFPNGLFESYDINLSRIKNTVNLFGINSAFSVGSFRFWTDISFLNNKVFTTDKLASDSFSIALTEAPVLSATTGFSYEYYSNNYELLLLSEYYHQFVFSNDSSLTVPPFTNILSVMANLSFPQIKTSANILVFYSAVDNSLFFNPMLRLAVSDELDFSISAPVFFGSKNTDFGQFSDNHLVTGSVVWRF